MSTIIVIARRVLPIFMLCLSMTAPAQEDELDSLRAQIQEMYVAYYGRPGDPEGIEFWTGQLQLAGGSLSSVVDAFGNSVEYRSRYGNLSNTDLVNAIFQRLLGRNADAEGLNFYVESLNSNERSLASIALDILNGVQGEDTAILSNKLQSAGFFTQRSALAGFNYDSSRIPALIALLDSVDSSAASTSRAMTIAQALVGERPAGYLALELSGPVDGATIIIEDARNPDAEPVTVTTLERQDWIGWLGQDSWDALGGAAQLGLLGLFRAEVPDLSDTLYVVTAQGGVDLDNNFDGQPDSAPAAVSGQWRALMTSEQLRTAGNRVSVLTESVFSAREAEIAIREQASLLALLNELAAQLVNDTNDDAATDYSDVLHWSRAHDQATLRADAGSLARIGVAVAQNRDSSLLKTLSNRVLGGPAGLSFDEVSSVRIEPTGSCDGRGTFIFTHQSQTNLIQPPAQECGQDDAGKVSVSVAGTRVDLNIAANGIPKQLTFDDGSVIQILECSDDKGSFAGRVGTNGPATDLPLIGACSDLREGFARLGAGGLLNLEQILSPPGELRRLHTPTAIQPANSELFNSIAAESLTYASHFSSWAGCAAYQLLLASISADETVPAGNLAWAASSCTSALSELAVRLEELSPSEVSDFEQSIESIAAEGCSDCFSYIVNPVDNIQVGAGEVIDFTGVAAPSAFLVNWRFGDGQGFPGAATRYSYPEEGHYVAEFAAVYSDGSTAMHTRNVTVQEGGCFARPTADAGRNFEVDTASQVTLSGSGTVYSPPGCTLESYSWEQIGTGPSVTLSDTESAVVEFQAPAVTQETELTFALTVIDSDGVAHTDTVTVTVLPEPLFCGRAPVANAGIDRVVDPGVLVSLTGFGTADSDPNCDIVALEWQQVSGSEVFSGIFATANIQFNAPDAGGELVFELRVEDSEGQVDTDKVTITVRSAEECADWLADAFVAEEPSSVSYCEATTIRGIIPPPPEGCSGSYSPWIQAEGSAPSSPLMTSLLVEESGGFELVGTFVAPNALVLDQTLVFEFTFAVDGAEERQLEKSVIVLAAPENGLCALP